MVGLWGNLNICPCLYSMDFPYHTPGELLSISCLKIWENSQKPCNGMAYLLVCTGDTSEAQGYGMALVWISPHQAWASMMEEAIGMLSIGSSSGPNWLFALAWLYEGSSHMPLPRGKHLGILPQGKVEESPYEQISQLEVHQLLPTGPQVVYPIGLNGNDEPVMTTLPKPLHSSASVTTNEHPCMRVNIPLLHPEELEHMTLPLGKVHTIPAGASPKTPSGQRISMATEVDNLLIQAMVEESSHESEHSPIGKVITVGAAMSPSHKSEALPPPVDTSSQASMEEGETTLESNPANISPIAAAYSSHSASPLVDPTERELDANLAAGHMLHVKQSGDIKRQRVVWELGLLLHQNEFDEATSIKQAKVAHS